MHVRSAKRGNHDMRKVHVPSSISFLVFAKWPLLGLIIKKKDLNSNTRSLAVFMPETRGKQSVIVRAVLNQAAYSSAFIQLEASSCGSRLFSPTHTFHTYALK